MKFIDSSYEIINQEPGLLGIYKQIEKAARTSYKSEDKITEGSAQKMVDTLIKNKHYACLEHGTVYLKFNDWVKQDVARYWYNPYSRCNEVATDGKIEYYVTTNPRVIIENGWQEDLQYICEPTEFHAKRITVKFTCSIGVGREITRHRVFSFMQESTRYCNYSKDRFNNELTFIIPQWIYDCRDAWAPCTRWPDEKMDYLKNYTGKQLVRELTCIDRTVAAYCDILEEIEREYCFDVTDPDGYKLKPQEARGILPLDLKSELVMTGFIDDWKHFFALRSYIAATGKPHPDIQVLADSLLSDFLELGYITSEEIKYLKGEVHKEQIPTKDNICS